MDRSNSIKLDALAEVCTQLLDEYLAEVYSQRLDEEFPHVIKHLDLVQHLKFTSPPLVSPKKRRTQAEKTTSSWNDAGIVLLGTKRHRVMTDIHEPNMPTALIDLIREKGGYDVKLIIEKKLFDADVNKGQNRFSMPLRQIVSDNFLNDTEKLVLSGTDEEGRKRNDGIVVGFIEPCFDETTMLLKKRDFTSTSSYVLIKNWNKIAVKNGLEEGDTVQAWFFRVHAHPWIALVKST